VTATSTAGDASQVAAEPDGNPFPGPRPYRRGQPLFFGRATETEELASLVLSSQAVLLSAPSGFGKSSLVEAGLLPELERLGVRVSPTVRLLRAGREVGGNPFIRLVRESLRGSSPHVEDDATLAGVVGDLCAEGALERPYLLVLDQFEEVFLDEALWPERSEFLGQLREALQRDDQFRLLIVMRSDYLEELIQYEGELPSRMLVRYVLDRADADAAREIVKDAFASTEVEIPDTDVDRLVDGLRTIRMDPPASPVRGRFVNLIQLQIVCRRLWSARVAAQSGDAPVVASLDRVDVDASMRSFVDEAITAVITTTGTDEGVVRRWLQDRLVRGRRRTIHVLDGSGGDLPAGVIDALEHARLIQMERRHRFRWAELTHDSMVAAVLDSNEIWFARHRRRSRKVTLVALLVLIGLVAGFVWVREAPPTRLLASTRDASLGPDGTTLTFRAARGRPVVLASIDVSGRGADAIQAKIFPLEPDDSFGVEVPHATTENDRDTLVLTAGVEPGRRYALRLTPSDTDSYLTYSAEVRGLPRTENAVDRIGPAQPLDVDQSGTGVKITRPGVYVVNTDRAYAVTVDGGRVLFDDAVRGYTAVIQARADTYLVLTAASKASVRISRIESSGSIGAGSSAPVTGLGVGHLVIPVDPARLPLRLTTRCDRPFHMDVVDDAERVALSYVRSSSDSISVEVINGAGRFFDLVVVANEPELITCTAMLGEISGRTIREPVSTSVGIPDGDSSAAYGIHLKHDAVLVLPAVPAATAKLKCAGVAEQSGDDNRLVGYVSGNQDCVLLLTGTSSSGDKRIGQLSVLPAPAGAQR
jgi:hypothetical protein